MRIVLQRVKDAKCVVENKLISAIDKGYLLLIGFKEGDTNEYFKYFTEKISKLRIFEDNCGKMNLGIKEVDGSILAISQFTLYANTKNGNRPSFTDAMKFKEAEVLYDEFCERLNLLVPTKKGIFGADMKLTFTNDGPVTILYDSDELNKEA